MSRTVSVAVTTLGSPISRTRNAASNTESNESKTHNERAHKCLLELLAVGELAGLDRGVSEQKNILFRASCFCLELVMADHQTL